MEQIVITNSHSFVPTLISEYALWDIPQKSFNINSWTMGEPLTDFCSETICLTIENLVISKILSLSFEIKEQKLLWLINSDRKDYFLKLKSQFDPNSLGWLEYHIIQEVLKNNRQGYKDLIRELLASFLNSFDGILSRSIIAAIAENAKSNFIRTLITKGFLSNKITIQLDKVLEATDYNYTCRAISEEQKANEEFGKFCLALRKFTRSELGNQQHRD